MNPGGKGCSEPRWSHCTPAWVTEQDSVEKKRKGRKEGREEEKKKSKVDSNRKNSVKSNPNNYSVNPVPSQFFIIYVYISTYSVQIP